MLGEVLLCWESVTQLGEVLLCWESVTQLGEVLVCWEKCYYAGRVLLSWEKCYSAGRSVTLLGECYSAGKFRVFYEILKSFLYHHILLCEISLIYLCPAALHTVVNISMHIFSISLIFLVSGILFF
jgi:hypothetical protein